MGSEGVVEVAIGCLRRAHGAREEVDLVAEEEADLAVARPERAGPHPDDVARRAQGVEVDRPVALDTEREHVGVERAGRDRCALQQTDGVDHPVQPAATRPDALPGRQEAGEGGLVDRLDLLAEGGQRTPPQLAEDLDVAPLALDAAGPELAVHEATIGLQRLQGVLHPVRRSAEPSRRGIGEERAVRTRA